DLLRDDDDQPLRAPPSAAGPRPALPDAGLSRDPGRGVGAGAGGPELEPVLRRGGTDLGARDPGGVRGRARVFWALQPPSPGRVGARGGGGVDRGGRARAGSRLSCRKLFAVAAFVRRS